jgi:hypothetical protein
MTAAGLPFYVALCMILYHGLLELTVLFVLAIDEG